MMRNWAVPVYHEVLAETALEAWGVVNAIQMGLTEEIMKDVLATYVGEPEEILGSPEWM